jgi:hypothetical protein
MKMTHHDGIESALGSQARGARLARIDQIDYAASTILTQREGHCPAAAHGLHTVLRGESHCAKCGAR